MDNHAGTEHRANELLAVVALRAKTKQRPLREQIEQARGFAYHNGIAIKTRQKLAQIAGVQING